MTSTIWHISLTFTAHLWWWTFIFWHMPITTFSLSIYCRMHGLSHALGKTFSKAELSVDIHHPLADDISSDVLLAYFTYFHSSSLIVYINFISHLFCLWPLLSSVCLLQNLWTVSHTLQDIRQSQTLCWRSSPLVDDVSGHTHLTYFHSSSLMVNINFIFCHKFMNIYLWHLSHYYLLSVYLL